MPADHPFRHTIRAAGMVVAVHTTYSDSTPSSKQYLHQDHLGSVIALTDEAGALIERLSYDPWGKRRPATGSTAWHAVSPGQWFEASSLDGYNRGFTGHEHLEDARHPGGMIGFIHMNGRVYDPELGVFLSADPFVQFPHSTQGINRYAYVGNNPLSYSDPSGFDRTPVNRTMRDVGSPRR